MKKIGWAGFFFVHFFIFVLNRVQFSAFDLAFKNLAQDCILVIISKTNQAVFQLDPGF